MIISGIPAKFTMPWGQNAASGTIRVIPAASQIGITPGAASLNDGFPVQTSLPVGAGGTPPSIQDMNGILNEVTAWNQWQQAGGPIRYDSAFQTAINGYPNSAVIASAVYPGGYYISTVDNNTNALVDNATNQTGWLYAFLASGANIQVFPPQTTWYVNLTTGNDSYDGTLASYTSGVHGPWKTIQHAVSVISSSYVYPGTITISVGGTGLVVSAGANWACNIGSSNIGAWYLLGNSASPSSCAINATATGARGFQATSGAVVTVEGFQVSSYYEAFVAVNHASLNIKNCSFVGSNGSTSIGFASYDGSYVVIYGNINVSGSVFYCYASENASTLVFGYYDVNTTLTPTVTYTGTPSFNSVALATSNALIALTPNCGFTTSGATSATNKYYGNGCAVINSGAYSNPFGTSGAATLTNGSYYI